MPPLIWFQQTCSTFWAPSMGSVSTLKTEGMARNPSLTLGAELKDGSTWSQDGNFVCEPWRGAQSARQSPSSLHYSFSYS